MRRVLLRTLVWAALGAVSSLARSVSAEPLPIELGWDAPAECPTRDDVVSELTRITRVKPGRVVTPIRAQAKIEHSADGRYHLRLRTQRDDQTGDTDLDATTCSVLKRGVTLVLALALGDGVDLVDEKTAAEDTPAPPPPPPPPPPRATPKPIAVVPPVAPGSDAGLRWSPWLAGSIAWGLSAKPSIAPELGLALGQKHWQALARVSYALPASAPRVQGIDASYSAILAALGACARWPIASWSLAGCGTFEAGAIHGRSSGAFQDGSATAPWYAAGTSLVVTAPLSRGLAVRLAGGLSIGFDPPHFAILGLRDVYVVARVVPAVSLGLSL